MKIITRHVYIANDGTEFHTSDMCRQHEPDCQTIEKIMAQLPKRPDTVKFANGEGYIQHNEQTIINVRLALLVIAETYIKSPYKKQNDYDQSYISAAKKNPSKQLEWAHHIIICLLCPRNLKNASYRMSCTNNDIREYGQPFYATNPHQAINKQLN